MRCVTSASIGCYAGIAAVLLVAAVTLLPTIVHAVLSFARQTGEKCIACHVSFPELTPFGGFTVQMAVLDLILLFYRGIFEVGAR